MPRSTRDNLLVAIVALFAVALFLRCDSNHSSESQTPAADTVDRGSTDGGSTFLPWIDTHAHPRGVDSSCTSESCVNAVVATMDAYNVRRTIFMHPPAPGGAGNANQEATIRATVGMYPDRFYYGAGGNMLNAQIHQTADSAEVTNEQRQTFTQTVESLLNSADVVCFGEMAALHVSYAENHAFEEIMPDAPLFLLLADLAADAGIPIDLHMDAVEQTMDTPEHFTELSSLTPDELQGNITALENLLSHNRDATIVWAHVGRDTTGDMTAELIGDLLDRHPNLVIQIHPVCAPLPSDNAIVSQDGTLRPEWLSVIEENADRVVLGTDAFYEGTETDKEQLRKMQRFLSQLPDDVAHQVGCENPLRIYSLPNGC